MNMKPQRQRRSNSDLSLRAMLTAIRIPDMMSITETTQTRTRTATDMTMRILMRHIAGTSMK